MNPWSSVSICNSPSAPVLTVSPSSTVSPTCAMRDCPLSSMRVTMPSTSSIWANVVADEAVAPNDKSATNATHATPASMPLDSFNSIPPNQLGSPKPGNKGATVDVTCRTGAKLKAQDYGRSLDHADPMVESTSPQTIFGSPAVVGRYPVDR